MAEDKKPIKTKKIVDVAHPGQTAPSPNSKSVIISHHPTMTDPMVNADPTPPAAQGAEPALAATPKTTRIVLQPLASSPKVADLAAAKTAPVVEAPAEPEVEEPAEDEEINFEPAVTSPAADKPAEPAEPELAEPIAKPVPEEPKPAEPVDTGSARGATDAKVASKGIESEADMAAAEDAELKRKADLEALIESKKFYLPINASEKERTRQFVAGGIVLSIVLIVAWADIALDAGIIHLGGVKALTHFFSQ